MNLKFLIITFITFIIFFLEAMVHFSIGKSAGKMEENDFIYVNVYNNFNIYLPNKTKLIKLILSIMFFSAISGLISSYFTN